MRTVCVVTQSVYETDPRVRRKAEALAAAGYSVDVLALRGAGATRSFVLNGVNVQTLGLGKMRGSLARYAYEYAAFFLWVLVRVPVLMRRRRYVAIDVNTLPDFLIFAPVCARWMGARLILDMHEITPEFYMSKYGMTPTSRIVRALVFLEKISFDFADYVVTINEPIQELLESRGLAPSKSIVVMHRLYFHEAKDGFYFAAEAKAILAVRPDLRSIEPRGLGEFISCGCVLENRTLLKHIYSLPGASS